jgi:LuxR family maltose regulon positive regulatory protein
VRSQELGEAAGLPQFPHRWRIAMAKLRLAEGDPEGALDLLDEAERVYVPDFFPNVRPIAAMKARVLIRQGRFAEAERWHGETNVAVTDRLAYLREFEHVTLARLLLARGESETALALLERLVVAAESGGRLGSVIEISVLQAVARQAQRDGGAGGALDRALTLAAPEGYVRVFVDEGEAMEALLRAAAKRGNRFARTLLAELTETAAGERGTAPHNELIEPLSERELDVLRLLRGDLDGPDIARELGVSLNTMRTHTKNIYEKLSVNNRRAAVRRGEELDLLQRR